MQRHAGSSESHRRRFELFTPINGLVLLTVAALAVTVWSYRYFGKYRPFASILDQQNNEGFAQFGLTINDAVVSVRSGGRRKLRVKAREVAYSRDHRMITLDNLYDGVLYDGDEKPQMQFSAGQLLYQTPAGDLSTTEGALLQLTGGIQATTFSPNGPRFAAEQIIWNSSLDKVEAPGAVRIVFPRGSGTALASDVTFFPGTRNLTVKHVHGTFRVSKLVQ